MTLKCKLAIGIHVDDFMIKIINKQSENIMYSFINKYIIKLKISEKSYF